jgi:F0F1-type ATP synthase beta subunit
MNKKGKITQIIGAVVDVNFENDYQKFIQHLK